MLTPLPTLPQIEGADLLRHAAFLQAYPAYSETAKLDAMRKTDYARLDEQGHVYLDYTGGNLYAISQIEKHHAMLKTNVFGNPHSSNPTSQIATKLVEETRKTVLDFFNAGNDYFCVFTANASASLKIIGECYPFSKNSHLLLSIDNHNSVNGLREYAKMKHSTYSYSSINVPDLRLNEEDLLKNLYAHEDKTEKLLAIPAQSNVSGVKHPLRFVQVAKQKGWDVLLDAAAFVPSNQLDLQSVQPDYISVSFYKIFGYPTGLGCLLIKKTAFEKLQKPWFAGGTVHLVSAMVDQHLLHHNHERFEDGTINYLDIPAIKIGIDHINEINIHTINTRVKCITGWLIDELLSIKHSNGQNVVKIFGPNENIDRGGTILLNFFHADGSVYPFVQIEQLANQKKISVRTGCFCNPGIDEMNSYLSEDAIRNYFNTFEHIEYAEMVEFFSHLRGAVRISVGLMSNFNDAEIFIAFAKSFAK
jgi:molybdenum cofactor sulfurtransferase